MNKCLYMNMYILIEYIVWFFFMYGIRFFWEGGLFFVFVFKRKERSREIVY